jgi:hypothetical protein
MQKPETRNQKPETQKIMYKEILGSLDQAAIFAIIAIIIFFAFFVLLFFRVITLDKKHVQHMAEMPLWDEAPEVPAQENSLNGKTSHVS